MFSDCEPNDKCTQLIIRFGQTNHDQLDILMQYAQNLMFILVYFINVHYLIKDVVVFTIHDELSDVGESRQSMVLAAMLETYFGTEPCSLISQVLSGIDTRGSMRANA